MKKTRRFNGVAVTLLAIFAGLIPILLVFLFAWPEPARDNVTMAASPLYDPAEIMLARAARKYGVDPRLLMGIVRFESAKTFSPLVAPPTGSAQGLCQMIRSTRRRYGVKKYSHVEGRPVHLVGYIAGAARKQAYACARFTRDQIALLKTELGRRPAYGEVYLCHLLGMPVCKRVIKADANTDIATLTSKAVRKANPFVARAGTAGGLIRAAGKMIKAQMNAVRVPPDNLCSM